MPGSRRQAQTSRSNPAASAAVRHAPGRARPAPSRCCASGRRRTWGPAGAPWPRHADGPAPT
eukprot:5433599-Alexandrium_andersonii.AAC.1